MFVKYTSNNSGGHWWLEDKDWKVLEESGWRVHWVTLHNVYSNSGSFEIEDGMPKLKTGNSFADEDGRWLRALARSAYGKFDSLEKAIASFEEITGQDASACGCMCCGQPHKFTLYDDNGKSL